jgi:hypothetical protein
MTETDRLKREPLHSRHRLDDLPDRSADVAAHRVLTGGGI